MKIVISTTVEDKLKDKHHVKVDEVFQCLYNRTHDFLIDIREEHLTDPATKWFVSETDTGRKLKICFIIRDENFIVKTAYEPEKPNVIDMYYRIAKEC